MNLAEARSRVIDADAALASEPVYVPDNVLVHAHFSPHSTAEQLGDPTDFSRLVKSADIYYPEEVGWDQEAIDKLAKVSKGDVKTYQRFRRILTEISKPFFAQVCQAIYSTWVVVDFLDVGTESPLFAAVDLLMPREDGGHRPDAEDSKLVAADGTINVQAAVDMHLEVDHDWILANRYRNSLYLTGFGPRTEALVAAHPKLRRKEAVKTLLTMGRMHERAVFGGLRDAAGNPDAVTESFGADGRPAYDERAKILDDGMSGVAIPAEEEYRLCLRGLFSEFYEEELYSDVFGESWEKLSNQQQHTARYAISAALTNEELGTLMGARAFKHPEHRQAREKLHQLVLANIIEPAEA
jgi:hypothetical protein